ncbi:hypothetical protein GCM10027612_74290 [Microbispora bryophytorum subsp. camponoti]
MAGRHMPSLLRPRSIQARTALMSAVLSLVFLTVIGFSLDIAIRNRIHDHLFMETQRVATDWISSMGSGGVPEPPATHKDLVQLVDSRNRVITASRAARGLAALTTPSPRTRTRCSTGSHARMRAGASCSPPYGSCRCSPGCSGTGSRTPSTRGGPSPASWPRGGWSCSSGSECC